MNVFDALCYRLSLGAIGRLMHRRWALMFDSRLGLWVMGRGWRHAIYLQAIDEARAAGLSYRDWRAEGYRRMRAGDR